MGAMAKVLAGSRPLAVSAEFDLAKSGWLEVRITNVPGRVLRQSQFLRSLSL
jgi:hypothetical protein